MVSLFRKISLAVLIALIAVSVSGCDLSMSTEDKQVEACIKDVQRSLYDPNSIELLSHRGFELKDGTYRIEIEYTAKNRMGGRVRDESLCGFKSKDSAEWNPDDLYNEMRDMAITFDKAGINLN